MPTIRIYFTQVYFTFVFVTKNEKAAALVHTACTGSPSVASPENFGMCDLALGGFNTIQSVALAHMFVCKSGDCAAFSWCRDISVNLALSLA